jgi:ferredoxin-NADP reductase
MKTIDNILNKITMYRVVLYELISLLIIASIGGFLGLLPYTPVNLLFSVFYILAICLIVNKIFAWAFDAPSNPESTYITALILALIISPALVWNDPIFLAFAFWASSLAVASKYILAIGKKHVFNPAALAVVVTAFALNQTASWWVGTAVMLPFVLLGGFLIVRKIKRFDLVWGFIMAVFVTTLGIAIINGGNVISLAIKIILSTPLVFFASVMLTEPLTTPPTITLQTTYGILTGILFAPFIHLGSIYSTPELALVLGNIFSYLVSPKKKLILTLKDIQKISADSYDFIFTPNQYMPYKPGQYMEWTLAHSKSDSRGIRRYFTLASSPTERELRLGIKFYNPGSSFKKKLLAMKKGESVVASGLAGDFVLPKDKNKKMVFIAGGIGITPFRSQIQYLIDKNEVRSITLLYSNKTAYDVAYKEVFDRAAQTLGIKTIYALTNPDADFSMLPNAVNKIDAETITKQIPDYKERTFYLSGPHNMVKSFEDILQTLGLKNNQIKTDFFPGFV